MPRLVLINGAPGSGKTTMAHSLARDRAMTLALDVDGIKHSLGRWDDDPAASGLHARRLSLALAEEQLRAGHDVDARGSRSATLELLRAALDSAET